MTSPWPLLLLALSAALAAPSAPYQDYPEVIVVQKRAALVLDRLLIALQKALHEDSSQPEPRFEKPDRDGPRTAPLRIPNIDVNDMMAGVEGWAEDWQSQLRDAELPRPAAQRVAVVEENTSSLQRRGQGGGRGRVLRCYFNAVTCF